MKRTLIDGIQRTGDFSDDLFLEIIETTDTLERAQFIEQIRRKCREVSRITEFNNLLKAWLQKHAQALKQATSNKTAFTDAPLILNCGKYKADDTGVVLHDVNQNGVPISTVACHHPILPVERLINIDTDTEKIKLAFFKDGQWRNITADCGTVFNRNSIGTLADRGVLVTSESAKELVKYISEVVSLNANEIPLYKSIGRLGWVGNEFAPYINSIKYDGENDFKSIYEHVAEHGDYQTWLDHVRELRKDINIRLMLATSFASPLIEIVGALPFVTHLWGTTGFGKTVSLMVASSIWGNPEMGCLTRTMNMTANAMARTSAFLYNVPFCADELQQIKTNWGTYDSLIMYLTEGIDRGRAKARGGVEEVKIWKNSFLFTGEEPVTKGVSGGGVKNRVIEIECEHKIIPDGNYTANLVKANYGHAGKKYINHIIECLEYDKQNNTQTLNEYYRILFKQILDETDTTDKQALSMALILLADSLSCDSIFGGQPLTINDVKQFLIPESAVRVEERAYTETLNLISRNQGKFHADSPDVWGRIDNDICIINKQVLEQELSKLNFDFNSVKKHWAKLGYLIKNSAGRYVHQTVVFGFKGSYVYINMSPDNQQEIQF